MRIQNKKYYIEEVESRVATKLIKEFHYSGKAVSNSNLHLGIYCLETDNLMGALQLGPPLNGVSTPFKYSDLDPKEMRELNRMVMTDDAPKFSESMALGLMTKWLKAERKDIKWVLSHSDGKEGNVGTIYQAANWKYLGYFISDAFYEINEKIIHRVSLYSKYQNKRSPFRRNNEDLFEGNTLNTVMCNFDHFTDISTVECKQFVYVMPLVRKMEFKKPFVDTYPKKETEERILKRNWLKKDGEVYYKQKVTKNTHKG